MEFILKTYDLSKKYNNKFVVDKINIKIKKGDIYGFLGQNGAGKTTTIAMIMGLLKPTSGEIEIFNENIKNKNRKLYSKVGSLVENAGFYSKLTAFENLNIQCKMMMIQDNSVVKECLKLVGLSGFEKKRVCEFSLGMRQRLGIARALINQPEFLILDEPINGLDPIGIKEVRELIVDLNKRREITFLISSHILSEMEQMATNIGIISKGKLIEEIDFDTFIKKSNGYISIVLKSNNNIEDFLKNKLNISNFIIDGERINIFSNELPIEIINKKLNEEDFYVKEIIYKKESLEEFFVNLTSEGVKR